VDLPFKTSPEDASLIEVLDRILDKGIVLEPWARVVVGTTDLCGEDNRIVAAADRRRKPFVIPK
jgi:hypothetical protein